MKRSLLISRPLCAIFALALAGVAAHAAPAAGSHPAPAAGSPAAIYETDRAACLSGRTQQDRETCLYEARSVLAQSRAGTITTAPAQTLAANALLRCQVHTVAADRSDCERMVRGEGETKGSVAAGGEVKSLTTRTIEPAATPR